MRRGTFGAVALGIMLGLFALPSISWAQGKKEDKCELDNSDEVTLANDAIQKALAADGQDVQARYQEALRRLEYKLKAKDGAALIVGAQAHVGLGEYDEADALLVEFLMVVPACSQPAHNVRFNAWANLYNRAVTAFQEDDREVALTLFDQANVMLSDSRSLNNAAFLHQEKGGTEEALELYKRSTLTEGNEEQLRNAVRSLGDLYESLGRSEEALKVFADYSTSHPDDDLMKVEYAVQLASAGQQAEAESLISAVLSEAELDGREWNTIGVDLYNGQRFDQASMAFRKAYDANPYDKTSLENLATALVESDRQEEALPLTEELVRRYPYDQASYTLLANSLANTNQQRRALQVMQRVENLTINLESLQLEPLGDGRYLVSGVVRPEATSAGTTITIPFELVNADGQVIANTEATLELPEANQARTFEITIVADQPPAGFRYRKAGSAGIGG